jgi:hypothetical protein
MGSLAFHGVIETSPREGVWFQPSWGFFSPHGGTDPYQPHGKLAEALLTASRSRISKQPHGQISPGRDPGP